MAVIARSEGHWTLWIDPDTMATTVSPGHGWDDTPGKVKVEVVHRNDLRGAVQAEREWCERILDVDQRDQGDGRLLAALANHAGVRLRELGGQ